MAVMLAGGAGYIGRHTNDFVGYNVIRRSWTACSKAAALIR